MIIFFCTVHLVAMLLATLVLYGACVASGRVTHD